MDRSRERRSPWFLGYRSMRPSASRKRSIPSLGMREAPDRQGARIDAIINKPLGGEQARGLQVFLGLGLPRRRQVPGDSQYRLGVCPACFLVGQGTEYLPPVGRRFAHWFLHCFSLVFPTSRAYPEGMATLFHRNAQAAVHHHGGGSLILGGVLAALLFGVFAIFLASNNGTWTPDADRCFLRHLGRPLWDGLPLHALIQFQNHTDRETPDRCGFPMSGRPQRPGLATPPPVRPTGR